MGKKQPKAPAAPTPEQSMQAQAKATPSVYGPQYSIERKINPTTGQFEAYIGESDATKGFRQQTEGLGSGLGSYADRLMGNLGSTMSSDYSGDANRLEQQTYQQAMKRMQPDLADRERQLGSSLAMRGIPMGSEAYNREMSRFEQDRNDAQQNAAFQAIGSGRQEQDRLANIRSKSFDELVGALGARAGNAPDFNAYASLAGGGLNGTQALDQQYQSQMQDYQNRIQRQNSMTSNLGGMIGSGLGLIFSSEEWKNPIESIDCDEIMDKVALLRIEKWAYKDEGEKAPPHIGCYAEQFHDVFGVGDSQTIHVVDALGVCMAAIQSLSKKVKELEAEKCSV